jgi:lysophospholipase L1-like esterase
VPLCPPSEVLERAQDTFVIKAREMMANGTYETFNHYWREANQHVHDVAGEHGIPVASVYDVFMGPDGTVDPRDRGLVLSDGLHATDQGGELIAFLFRELGYGYAEREQ